MDEPEVVWGDEDWLLQVSDLKQFAFCPRVVYYKYCLPLLRPVTYKMIASRQAHEEMPRSERRRSLRIYGLEQGERHFDVALTSRVLKLSGRADLVIVTADQAVPVDYKMSRRKPGAHWRLQIAAYAEMLEESWHLPVRKGYLYLIPLRKAEVVQITGRLRKQLHKQLAAIHKMVETGQMPEPTRQRGRCVNCEYRRFCNDVL